MKKTLNLTAAVLMCAAVVFAKTENGNDTALLLEEAKDNKKEFDQLVKETKGKNFYFRYLEIQDMKSGRENNRPYVRLVTMEPSSYFIIKFTIVKPLSLTKLFEEPISKRGTGLAVTGKIASVDREREVIELNPVIIRTKDRLAPKRGKELLGEIDPSATYYSFTGVGGKPIKISFADKDLLPWSEIENPKKAEKLKKEIQQNYTREEWANHLLGELEKRKSGKESKFADAARRAGVLMGSTNAPILPDD